MNSNFGLLRHALPAMISHVYLVRNKVNIFKLLYAYKQNWGKLKLEVTLRSASNAVAAWLVGTPVKEKF